MLRVVATGSKASLFQCLVDLEALRVVVGGLFDGTWQELAGSPKGSTPSTGPYRLRFTAKGSQLTCQLVGGPTLTATDTRLAKGNFGFTTYHASACFEYLVVTVAP